MCRLEVLTVTCGEWISGEDQWNKATHVNLVASRVYKENSARLTTKLLIRSEHATVVISYNLILQKESLVLCLCVASGSVEASLT